MSRAGRGRDGNGSPPRRDGNGSPLRPEGEGSPRRRQREGSPRRRQGRAAATVGLESDRGVFMISVAAQLAEMHPQTLRMYEARGLIEPKRSPKGTRLYSQEDVEKLRRIQQMTAELGLNLAGVERVLRLEDELAGMQARIEEIELEALQAQVRLAQEIEEVRRSFRAELTVPYRGGLELVRAADARSPFGKLPKGSRNQQRRF